MLILNNKFVVEYLIIPKIKSLPDILPCAAPAAPPALPAPFVPPAPPSPGSGLSLSPLLSFQTPGNPPLAPRFFLQKNSFITYDGP